MVRTWGNGVPSKIRFHPSVAGDLTPEPAKMSTRYKPRPIDRDLRERSPSGGWREVAYVMHTAAAHPDDGPSSDPEGDLLERFDLEESNSMSIDDTAPDLEVST